MMAWKSLLAFAGRPAAITVTVSLLAQLAFFAAIPPHQIIPLQRPLKDLPSVIGSWQLQAEYPMEQEIQDLLKADETTNRLYVKAPSAPVSLFVAYFRSQRAGSSPHSPKVCLPGSGWTPTRDSVLELAMPGVDAPIQVNRYTVSKGESRSVVLYFYQSNGRALANEYRAKLYSMYASVRYHRSDAALVRVVVPVQGVSEDEAERVGVEFLRAAYPVVNMHLPR